MSKKNIIATFVFLAIAFAVTIAYFSPAVLGGKAINASDTVQFAGMSKWPVDYYQKTGEKALWNVGMFGGGPNYMISTGPATMFVHRIHVFLSNLIPNSASGSQLMLSLICFFILLRTFGVNPYISIAGALIYTFNTYNIINIEVGHATKLWAISYSCLVLAGMRLAFKGKWMWGLPLFMLGLALELNAGHIQITYYLVFICGIYGINELVNAIKASKSKQFVSIALGLLLMAGISGATRVGHLWLTKEYAKYSIRGERILTPLDGETSSANPEEGLNRDYAYGWSQGKIETFTMLVPYFYGGGSNEKPQSGTKSNDVLDTYFGKDKLKDVKVLPLYFGDQPGTAGPLYAGAITCFLFILGLFILDGRDKYWILAGVILAMMFAWGRNLEWFNYFLFDHLPGFNKLRSVSMALSLAFILMNLLGFMALDKVFRTKDSTVALEKKLMYAAGIVAGLALLVWFSSLTGDYSLEGDIVSIERRLGDKNQQLVTQLADALASDRASLRGSDALRSFMLIAFAFVTLLAYLKRKIAAKWALLIVAILGFGDMWTVAKRYLYDASFKEQTIQQAHQKMPADELILRDKDPHYRVYNLRNPFNEANTAFFHKAVGGYNPAKLRRIQDIIERQLTSESQKLIQNLQSGNQDFSNLNVLNMLNAKYFKYGDSEREVILNRNALGNAWFVQIVIDANDADEEMAKLGSINTANSAVINMKEFELTSNSFAADSAATIKLLEENPRKMVYESNSSENSLAVFSEIYYPVGWTATIDGQVAPIIRANYALRALQIPAGKHTIEMNFNPESYRKGLIITETSGYIFFILLLVGFGFAFYKQSKKTDIDTEEVDVFSEPEKKRVDTNASSNTPSTGTARKSTNRKKRKPKR